jgi:GT2 family glycosyltransferase
MFMRRADLADMPWDEGYRCYWVDTDWCIQLKRRGKLIYCVPQAHVTHYENNRSGRKKSCWRIWQFHWGALRVYRKYYTHGLIDPRSWFALLALSGRAVVQVALNSLKRNSASPAPITEKSDSAVGDVSRT